MTTHRNDWRHTIVLFAIVGFTESLAFGHLSAFTPLFLRELAVPPDSVAFWTGALSSLGFVIGLPLLPFWGVWADRYGRKVIIIRSSVFAAIIYALSGLSTTVWMLATARFLGGLVLGNTGVMMAVQADITPRERLGSSVAIISAGSPVGMAIGPYLGGLVVAHFGIRTLLFVDALLTGLVVVALVLKLKEEDRHVAPDKGTWNGVRAALEAIAHTPPVLALFVAVSLMAFGISMAQPYAPMLIEDLYRGPRLSLAPTVGLILTIWGITMALTTPIWGRLGDIAGHLRVMRICAVAVAGTLAAQATAATLWQMGVYRAGQGAFQGGVGALAMVLLTLYTPRERRSAVLTLSLLPQQVAWFLGPLAASFLALQGHRLPFAVGAVAVLLGVAASLRLGRAREPAGV